MRKKRNARFAIKYRGYDIKEVESYIADVQAGNDNALIEQKERIADLKKQNTDLTNELTALRSREEQIKLTLLKATKTAEELDADLRRRYQAELERLKLFSAKWTSTYEEIKERYNFSKDALNMESVIVQTELNLTAFLSQDFSLAKGSNADEMENYFKQEVNRLKKVQQDMSSPKSVAGELKAKLGREGNLSDEASLQDSAFALDEQVAPAVDGVAMRKSLSI